MKRGVASSENGDKKAEIKRMAREQLVEKWQQRWDSETTGRWIHTLISKLRVWVDGTQGQMGYYLTQAMTGHGKFNLFNAYLKRIKKRTSAECTYCGCDPDDVRHTLFECSQWVAERRLLEEKISKPFTEENMVTKMLENEEKWHVVETFITTVLKKKEEDEWAQARTNLTT